MTAPRLLSLAELKALRPVTPRAGGVVTLWGRPVPWQPLSVALYERFILSRFEASRAFFVLGSQVHAASQVVEAAEADGREPDISALKIVDGKAYTDAQATDGGQANMAFIACGIGAPGDEDIERQLLDASDDELAEALTTIEDGTWGDDPARFFGRLGQSLAGRPLTVLQAASRTEKASTTPTTSTRTAGKATTARARKPKPKGRSRSRRATTA